MKAQVKAPLIVVAVVALVAVLVFFGMKAMGAGDLDQGQVKYTPGVPPFQETDPAKRGPGGAPGGGGPGAAPVPTTRPDGVQAAPPGLAAPTLGNGK